MNVRQAVREDIDGISRVHVASWQTTYKGIIDDAHLSGLSVEQRRKNWEWSFRHVNQDEFLYVAEDEGGKLVGFIKGGKCREPDLPFEAEIYAFYLLEEAQGKGYGRLLFSTLTGELQAKGYRSMMVWVLKDNPSVGFYKRLGGQTITEKQIKIGSGLLTETALGWSEI